jgi:hypothetical protein
MQHKYLLFIPFPRLPQSSTGTRNTECPWPSLISYTDEQQLV